MTSYGSLSSLLPHLPPERPIWRTPGEQTVTAGQIAAFLTTHESVAAAGQVVALRVRQGVTCGILMMLLDGVAQAIVFIPSSLSTAAALSVIERAHPALLMTDAPAEDASLGVPTCSPRVVWSEESGSTGGTGSRQMEDALTRATRWVIPTSGTTGPPKLVAHTLASLTRTVHADPLPGKQHRWGSLYNLMGFAGLQVFLQSWFGGSCLLMSEDSMVLPDQVALLARGGCTALSATPTMWRSILMTPRAGELPLRQITLGGEIVQQQILDALRIHYPHARLTQIYASTESGVGFAVNDGLEGFPASFLGQPPRGLSVRVSPDGHLQLRSECGEQHYLGGVRSLQDGEGFIDTGDVVERVGDRYMFLGRADGRINVGGNKVYPEEVERVLCSLPGVSGAAVSSIRSSLVGELVEAKVVPAESLTDAGEFRQRLLRHCRANLTSYKVPAVVTFVDSLTVNSNGKVIRVSKVLEPKPA